MRVRSYVRSLSCAVAGLIIVAGCASGGQSPSSVPPVILPGAALMFDNRALLDAKPAKSVVYASTFNPSQVNAYALPDVTNAAPKCTFATSYVFNLGVDSAGTLWVPQFNPNRVTTYKKGTCKPAPLTLSEPADLGADIAFSSAGTAISL